MAATKPGTGESLSDTSPESEISETLDPTMKAIREHVFHEPRGQKAWQLMPELPAASEIMVAQAKAEPLPENPIDSAWASKDDYLETHYRLLRREGTEALRYAVNKYKSNPAAGDDEDMCIYTKVRVLGYLMSRLGPLCRIAFSTDHAQKRIMWQMSRRLRPGAVLAISTKRDNFSSICMTATVAQRPYRGGLDQNPPQVDIVWGNVSDYVVDPDMELIMVEARAGYFESVRHTLVGLQMAADTDSPLFKYVVDGDKSDGLASFIHQEPVLDLSSCLAKTAPQDTAEWLRQYDVREPMPDIRGETPLDESQLHALYRMITKELCIVQGPPGTGKTFTSVEALRVVLKNQKAADSPIIVAAQTNHALDQLLGLCLDAGARIIRVGGRTESDRIAEHTMYNARQQFGGATEPALRALEARRRKACTELTDLAATIFNDKLLQPGDLLDAGVITQEQYDSLVDEEMETTEIHRPHGPFSLWISGECIETSVVRNKHCDQRFVGDDDEYNHEEYEYEEDFENIADDDEDEDRIMGTFIPLRYKWTGREPEHLSSGYRRATRELKKSDLYEIPKDLRGAVYQLLFARYVEKLRPGFLKYFAEYVECCKEIKAHKWQRDTGVVRQAQVNIVGCTTTGLTKYRGFLAALGAKTILVEEAAETRESNITSALYPSVQQLILVGDHMQLAPSCGVRWLGQNPYNLGISMFERMVNYAGLPYIMLDQQRRMAPEIRAVMDHFYDGLMDHPVALKRAPVPGMGDKRTWLFAHNWEDGMDANHSRFNSEEATMVVNFYGYLLNNGVKQSQITVLTFYKAQRRIVMKKLNNLSSFTNTKPFHVHTVDSYQGEENDIVLLSLVRSPGAGREPAVGFLNNKNRVIVAISRARRGFYMFGNIANASRASAESHEIWVPIWNAFASQKRYDPARGLPLQCKTHGKTIWFKNTSGWDRNNGGCDQRCDFVHDCGHRCAFFCHVMSHDTLRCSQMCGRRLACGHVCPKWCKDPCNCTCAAFQAMKTQNKTRQMKDDRQMHQDLEELLQAEAAGDSQLKVSPPKPENMQISSGFPAVAKPRKVIRLDAQEPRKPGPAKGKHQGSHANRSVQRPPQKFAQPPSKPAGPIVRLPAQRLQTASNPGIAAFQEFAQNISEYDMATAKALQASLAETAGQVPKITDTYRPVKLVDGRRVETPSYSSPENGGGKVVIQDKSTPPSSTVTRTEMDCSTALIPELLHNEDSDVCNTTTQFTECVPNVFDMTSVLATLPENDEAFPALTPIQDRSTAQASPALSPIGNRSTSQAFSSVASTVGDRSHTQAYANLDDWLETLPAIDGGKEFQGQHEVAESVASAVEDQGSEDKEDGDLLITF